MAPRTNLPGSAELKVAHVAGRSAVLRSRSCNPLRLLTPRTQGPAVWAYTSSFGGGMVAGDETTLSVAVDPNACCFLTTQASTKIYRNPANLPCSHKLDACLAEDALLVLAPDPVQCFAESRYSQIQTFHLEPTSNLVLVDWFSSGRIARGERWAFHRYSSRNEIFRSSQRLLLDSLVLQTENQAFKSDFVAGHYHCLATIVMLGPRLQTFAAKILTEIGRESIESQADVIYSASPLHDGTIVRLAGASVESTGRAIFRYLGFVPELLHGNPWARKW